MTPEQTIRKIADVAHRFAAQAGVGATETAGHFISYLTAHPEKIDAFLADEMDLITEGADGDLFAHERGCLSWHGADGKVFWPDDVRALKQQPDH